MLKPAPESFRFDRFRLDPADRQLRRDDQPVELNARYLDALTLLVREAGKLVSKDRFLQEVWRGVPVTDEALTQCIKTLRRQLGDEAAAPRFIETVPKHGYRFIAPVEAGAAPLPATPPSPSAAAAASSPQLLRLGADGTLGGGLAGSLVGLVYGFAASSQTAGSGMGSVSILLVLVCLGAVLGLIAGAGVAFGVAWAGFRSGRARAWCVLGGAGGGLVVGAFGKLIGLDAFNLLFGRSPGEITGALEGVALGGALGLAVWLGGRRADALTVQRSLVAGGLAGGAAGVLLPLAGGRLMGGSLDLLARRFPESRLRLDPIGALFGERGFGPVSQVATGALEGMLFGACVVGAVALAHRRTRKEAGRTLAGGTHPDPP